MILRALRLAVFLSTAWLVLTTHALAAGWLPLGHTGAFNYTGPGDVVSGASYWWGLRCYNAARGGSAQAVNIRRASDNATQDIGLTSTCNLDVATAATFCNATTCFATKLYDQSGNGHDVSQATQANQPQLIFNCLGSLPCLQGNGTSMGLVGSSGSNISEPWVIYGVAERTANFTTQMSIVSPRSNPDSVGVTAGFNPTTNTLFANAFGATSVTGTGSDSAYHVMQVVSPPASTQYQIRVDATLSSLQNSTQQLSSNVEVMQWSVGSYWLKGNFLEGGAWPVGYNSSTQTSVCNNANSYWTLSVSC